MIDTVLYVLLAVATVAGVARALRPGQLEDRVIGFDVAVLGLIGLFAVAVVADEQPWLLDALPLLGLLAVVATVTFSRAVGRRR